MSRLRDCKKCYSISISVGERVVKKINKKHKIGIIVIAFVAIIAIFTLLIQGNNLQILNPQGTIADQQKDLLVFAALLSLLVVIPVFIMAGFIAYKYREGNTKSKYAPDWESNNALEAVWWGVPIILITILSVVTYRTSHSLDPFRPIEENSHKTKTIQVVALQYKWLFIYPEEKIATVNYFHMPEDTPVKFEITSDAPMNSFWIPQLGGQIYAMSGMSTELNLMAESPGSYDGYSANISGEGFADMKFNAVSQNQSDYLAWVNTTRAAGRTLDKQTYEELSRPGSSERINYSAVVEGLYDTVVGKYMAADHKNHEEREGY